MYICLVAALALQRALELRISRRNEAELKALGAEEHARAQRPWMVLLHAAWLVSSVLEVVLWSRPFLRGLALVALVLFCAGQALRLAAIHALGERWTVGVITLPGAPPVSAGVFRYLRHPNYTGVALEIASLPLVHCAWLTALVFSAANAALLQRRVRAEERALGESSDYGERFRARPRFWPSFAGAQTSKQTE